MRASFQIAKLFGIPLRLHWSFGLMLPYVYYIGEMSGASLSVYAWIAALFLLLFASVVLHELAHALVAQYYGVQTRDIILSPVGGVARLVQLPERPVQEFWVALAGPLVNLALALVLGALSFALSPNLSDVWDTYIGDSLFPTDFNAKRLIFAVAALNAVLALFNLLPAFPMDGGRIFRALLAMLFGKFRATQVAAITGQLFGFGFMYLGLQFQDITFGILGLFVFAVAANELRNALAEFRLRGRTVADALYTEAPMWPAETPMHEVWQYVRGKRGRYHLVLADDGQLLGYLDPYRLSMMALGDEAPQGTAGGHARPCPATLSPDQSLYAAHELMTDALAEALPVLSPESGRPLGVLYRHSIRYWAKRRKRPLPHD